MRMEQPFLPLPLIPVKARAACVPTEGKGGGGGGGAWWTCLVNHLAYKNRRRCVREIMAGRGGNNRFAYVRAYTLTYTRARPRRGRKRFERRTSTLSVNVPQAFLLVPSAQRGWSRHDIDQKFRYSLRFRREEILIKRSWYRNDDTKHKNEGILEEGESIRYLANS